jgi:hypothetical protein
LQGRAYPAHAASHDGDERATASCGVADITGKTGMEIIRAIVAGQHDPEELVKFRDCRCRNPLEVMIAALTGNYRPEHLFYVETVIGVG